MSAISVTSLTVPSAELGAGSPLPPLDPPVDTLTVGAGVPAEIAERIRAGGPPSLVPYLVQDGYGRDLVPRPMRVAVLDDGRMRATVALELGGRVRSLRDLVADRELLYVNPVLQPANLALRNAWFSGGIEWNIGIRGHSPTTMSPIHAARVEAPDGTTILRLWEWERIRGVAFQVDLWLPDEATALAATVRIRNVNDHAVPMYWWSTTAVVADAGTRVLVPASRAFRTEYPGAVRVAAIPDDGEGDTSYPANAAHAADWFYDLAGLEQPWIAAVDADGRGLLHASTARLGGRKLFVWGTTAGGPRWQGWLSHDGEQDYAEIQGGLAPTQFEHLPMPPRADWSWTEVYAPLDLDAATAHGEWPAAVEHTRATAVEAIAPETLGRWHDAAVARLDIAPVESLSTGSGWGALERRRRSIAAEVWFDDTGTPFDDGSLGPEQAPWLDLLATGVLRSHAVEQAPASYVADGDWDARLAAAPASWLTEYHRAVIAHGSGDATTASEHYVASLAHAESAWARRGLAEVARQTGRAGKAADHAVAASGQRPGDRWLAAEAVERLLEAGRPADALALLARLPDAVRRHGRLRLLEGFAALAAGDVERARAILDEGLEIADLREGERSVDALWSLAYPDRDLPPHYDFRMH